jgi:ubiquinone/menaquinone biosynthesis C-methylase UbiE
VTADKAAVRDFWNARACGEVYATGDTLRDQLEAQARARYELEPYLKPFARFKDGEARDVLEIGVGMGADHLEWARSRPRSLRGVDLTPRAVEWTSGRLAAFGYESRVELADAERLPYRDDSFDIVYSWGVLHHTPNTAGAMREAVRVLRPGGMLRLMVYNRRSVIGALLWLRFALLAGRPWRSLRDVLAHHLESPGTQGFTVAEVSQMLSEAGAQDVRAWTVVSMGDLLTGAVGSAHGSGGLLTLAKRIWPRALIRRYCPQFGTALLATAKKVDIPKGVAVVDIPAKPRMAAGAPSATS